MGKIELPALRARARAMGISPGLAVRLQRARDARLNNRSKPEAALSKRPPARLLIDPAPLRAEDVKKWVVAVCKPNMSPRVGEDLSDLGFLAYCPLGRKIVVRGRVRGSDKRQRRIEQFPVFGPYLFVGERDQPLVKDVHDGIIAILSDSSGPLSINPAIVLEINKAELEGRWDASRERAWETPEAKRFKRGSRVGVLDGPFTGLDGLVEACGKAGITVGVNIFGRVTPITFEPKALELV